MTLGLCSAAFGMVACGSTGPRPPSTTQRSLPAVPTTVTTGAPTTTTLQRPDLLSGFGSTQVEWAASHQMDPAGPGYWPRLSDGLDTYASVRFVHGRALRYTENLYPAAPLTTALNAIGDELPPDARLVRVTPSPPGQPRCAQVVESSATLQVLAGVEVLAELRSRGVGYDSAQVSSITYQPLAGPASAPPSC